MLKSGLTMGYEDTCFAEYQRPSTVLRKSLRTESKILTKYFQKPINDSSLKRLFVGRKSTKLYLLAICGHIVKSHVTNATPTVEYEVHLQ